MVKWIIFHTRCSVPDIHPFSEPHRQILYLALPFSSRVIKDFFFSIVSLDNNSSSAEEAQKKNCYDKLPVVIIFDFAIKNFHSMAFPLLLLPIISPACHDSFRFWYKTGSLYDKKPFSREIFKRSRYGRVPGRYQSTMIFHTILHMQTERRASREEETALIWLPSPHKQICEYRKFNIAQLHMRMPMISFPSPELNYLNRSPQRRSVLTNNDFLMLLQHELWATRGKQQRKFSIR